jgi:plastocyanin
MQQHMKAFGIVALLVMILAGGYVFFMGGTPAPQEDAMMGDEKAAQEENMEQKEADAGTAEGETAAGVKELTVEGNNFSFVPATLSVKKGDTVRITFKNTGGFHDLVIDEFDVATKQLQGGAEETVQFVAYKTGTFEYYCSVGSHRAMGMVGTLTVSE